MSDNALVALAFAASTLVSSTLGYVAGHVTKPETIHEAHFGFNDLFEARAFEDHPHCMTDFRFSDRWSTRLMYLNGVWTAACLNQSYEGSEP